MEDTKTCLEKQPLSQEMLEKMNAYWRAANYLSAGQLYLLDNPLLKKTTCNGSDQEKKSLVTGELSQDRTLSMYTATVKSNVMIWI